MSVIRDWLHPTWARMPYPFSLVLGRIGVSRNGSHWTCRWTIPLPCLLGMAWGQGWMAFRRYSRSFSIFKDGISSRSHAFLHGRTISQTQKTLKPTKSPAQTKRHHQFEFSPKICQVRFAGAGFPVFANFFGHYLYFSSWIFCFSPITPREPDDIRNTTVLWPWMNNASHTEHIRFLLYWTLS